MAGTETKRPEFQFSEDDNTNDRMNAVLEIIGNHPDGISFNRIAELAAKHVSRSTLGKWLDTFEEYKAIERNSVRQGQTMMIKTSEQYQKWLEVQEVYGLEIGSTKKRVAALRAASDGRKFGLMDFYEIYKLQTEMMRIPFDSYLAGLKYSSQVANLLRDSAVSALEPLYVEVGKIVAEQVKRYTFNHQEIFANLHTLVVTAPYLELAKGQRKGSRKLGSVRVSMNTARQKLQNAF